MVIRWKAVAGSEVLPVPAFGAFVLSADGDLVTGLAKNLGHNDGGSPDIRALQRVERPLQ